MNKGIKVFLISLITGIILALFAALYYDVQERKRYYQEYQNTIMSLNDSIASLKSDLEKYSDEIAKLDLERDSIRKEIKIIFKDNEKIDALLANGDWDYNLKFLTEFLSEKDSVPE